MIWQVDFWLLLILVVVAITAISLRDLLATVIALSAYSFLAAVLFAQLGAVDVAFVEATLGAGISGVLFTVAIYFTRRKSED
jgi:energy-converting hydrogenase B subunit D